MKRGTIINGIIQNIDRKLIRRLTAMVLVYAMFGTQIMPVGALADGMGGSGQAVASDSNASTGNVVKSKPDMQDTFVLSGNIIFLGDGIGSLFEPKLMLYIDGEPASDKTVYISKSGVVYATDSDAMYADYDEVPIYDDRGIETEDLEVSGEPIVIWSYWVEDLPRADVNGNLYEYSIKAVDAGRATASNATSANAASQKMLADWELFYSDADGLFVNAKDWNADARHLTYVKKSELGGTYETDMDTAVLPNPIPLTISAADEEDMEYLGNAKGWIDTGAGSWTITDALMYNPYTGEPIIWRAQAHPGNDHPAYSLMYQNIGAYEMETEYLYDGGTIVNETMELPVVTYSATGTIIWEDGTNWHGKRPVNASVIKVYDENDTDVTAQVEVKVLPAATDRWDYRINGLNAGTGYRVAVTGYYYHTVPEAGIAAAKDGEIVKIEPITARVKTSRYYGRIEWESVPEPAAMVKDLKFLKLYDNGTEITNYAEITLTGASADNKTWFYSVDGLVSAVQYRMTIDAPIGYATDLPSCNIGTTASTDMLRSNTANQISPILMRDADSNLALKATVTARYNLDNQKIVGKAGETVFFDLYSTYATPIGEPHSFVVSLSGDTEYFDFSYSNGSLVTEAGAPYEGWIKIPIPVVEGQGNQFIYYHEANKQIGYTLNPGATLQTSLGFKTANGTTPNGAEIILEPELVGEPPTGWVTEFKGDDNSVTAGFAWDPVKKVSKLPEGKADLGDILVNGSFPDIEYTITANNAQGGESTGVIFTDQYTITDTLSLTSMYIDLSGGAQLVQGDDADNNKLVLKVNGERYNIMQITGMEPGGRLTFQPVVGAGNKVREIKFTYTLDRDQSESNKKDITDPALTVRLWYGTKMMEPALADILVAERPVETMHAVKNHVLFEAKSHFYEKTEAPTSEHNQDHYHKSQAQVSNQAKGTATLEKLGYNNPELIPNYDPALGTTYQDNAEYGEYMYYSITFKNTSAAAKNVYLSDLLVTHDNNGKAYYDLDTLTIKSIKTDGALYNDNGLWDEIDPDKTYPATTYPRLDQLISYDTTQSSDYRYTCMYKAFQNVKIGEEIQIIYRVKLLTEDSNVSSGVVEAPAYGYNIATVSLVPPSDGVVDALMDDFTQLYLNPTDGSLGLRKLVADTEGNEINSIDTGGNIIFAVGVKNQSNNDSAYFTRLVEVWPFEGVELTAIDLEDTLSGNESQVQDLISTLKFTFYHQEGAIDTPGNQEGDGAQKDSVLAWWTAGKGEVNGVYKDQYDVTSFLRAVNALDPKPDYFTITRADGQPIEVKPGNEIAFYFYATVHSEKGVANEVWLEYPEGTVGPGPSTGVELGVNALAITTQKKAYKVSADEYNAAIAAVGGSGDYRDVVSLGSLETDYNENDYVRYEIVVKNTSKSVDLTWVNICDQLPRMITYSGEMPTAIYYQDYDDSHPVIPLEPDTSPQRIQNIPNAGSIFTGGFDKNGIGIKYEKMQGTGYRVSYASVGYSYLYLQALEDTLGQSLKMKASNSASGGDEIRFHVYFKITDKVVEEALNISDIKQRYNVIRSFGGSNANDTTNLAYADSSVLINVQPTNEERKIEVNKDAYGVIKKAADFQYGKDKAGLPPLDRYQGNVQLRKEGIELSAENGDYIMYQLRLKNRTHKNVHEYQKMDLYAVWDRIPDGTEFIGFAYFATSFPTTGVYYYVYQDGYQGQVLTGYMTSLGDYDSNYWGHTTALSDVTVAYDPNQRIASMTLNTLFQPEPGNTEFVYVLVRVTDEEASFAPYDNVGGFATTPAEVVGEGVIRGTDYDDKGYQLTTDDASVNGPVYYAGINKKAVSYRDDVSSDWEVIKDGAVPSPGYQVKWEILVENSKNSTNDFTKYTLKDTLPKGLTLMEAQLELADGSTIQLPVDTVETNPDESISVSWEIDTSLPEYNKAIIPVGGSLKLTIVSGWNTKISLSPYYGSYTNRAYLTLDKTFPMTGHTSGKGTTDKQTIYSDDTVNMMGNFVTTSYKTITNVSPESPYVNEYATAENYPDNATTLDYIHAIVGDTVKYTLTVNNGSTNHAVEKLVIIDILPHIGDTGVVNASQERYSEFNLLFAQDMKLTVNRVKGSGTSAQRTLIDAGRYTATYAAVNGATSLAESDWGGGAGTRGWGSRNADSNAIKLVFNEDVKLEVGETIEVIFQARIPTDMYAAGLPQIGDIAWNSFGYKYHSGGSTLYAEPIRVGVKVPYSTIDVNKQLVNAKGETVTDDPQEFTFLLEYKVRGRTEWLPAKDISYYIIGKENDEQGNALVYQTDEFGNFKLAAGQKIRLYVPSGYYYRVTEPVDRIPDGYGWSSGELLVEPAKEEANYTVEFINNLRFSSELPETGGIGTHVFKHLGGLLMMVGAVTSTIYWFRSKKKKQLNKGEKV